MEKLVLCLLKSADDVLTLEIDVSEDKFDQVRKLASLNSPNLKNLLKSCGLEPVHRNQVFAVAALVSTAESKIPKIPGDWLNLPCDESNFEFRSELAFQVVQRVAIERSLLHWATWKSQGTFGILRLLSVPLAAYRVRRFSVHLLTDQFDIAEKYESLRKSLNLSSVRVELMDRARSWWAAAGFTVALLGFLAAPFLEYVLKDFLSK